jgi:hypothetical protein
MLTVFPSKSLILSMLTNETFRQTALPLINQSVFCAYDKTIIYPVPGAWGTKGYTYIDLKKIKKPMLKDALACAYQNTIAKKK